MFGPNQIPRFLLTDSYKLVHNSLYPKANKLIAYGSFRSSFQNCSTDHRIVFYGLRYIIETYLLKPITQQELDLTINFLSTHNTNFTSFPFPIELFQKVIDENHGYFPIRIRALDEGSVIYPHVPVFIIEAENEYSGLVTYLESLLTMIWYPSTVATLSKRCKEIIATNFDLSVDQDEYYLLDSRLHDFGFRACTSIEQSIIGGSAHLLNFKGSDTLTAAWYCQTLWNNNIPIATSIPATEHSIMTSHSTEKGAMMKLMETYGSGIYACVMDSYDYQYALSTLLPSLKTLKLEKNGILILRPDSGDPIETVLEGLKAADKVFGSDINSKGYKVLRGCGVIQGDGIDQNSLKSILDSVLLAGYSAQNVAFGMGGGLLQKLNRDTMSFATKLCFIEELNGKGRDIMKCPKTDSNKNSLPGQIKVIKDQYGLPNVQPRYNEDLNDELKVVYDHGKVIKDPFNDFQQIKDQLEKDWKNSPKIYQPLSKELNDKIIKFKSELI